MTLQQMWRLLPQRLEYGHRTGDYDPVMSLVLELANAWYAYKFPTVPREDREDWAQEACLRFWTRIEQVRADTCNRYLVRLLFTNYIDMTRRPHPFIACDPHDALFASIPQSCDMEYEEACFLSDMERILAPQEYALLNDYLKGYSTRDYARNTKTPVREAYQLARTLKLKIQQYWEIHDADSN